jgi:hypothetical protein
MDWNIVIGIIGGIATPLIAYFMQSRKKAISYAVSDMPIISMN